MIPIQKRYVDPYQDILSQDVNKRLMAVYPSGKGIVYRCQLSINDDETIVTLEPGIVINDYVVINIKEEVSFSVDSLTDGDYYIIGVYTFDVVSPPPELDIQLTTSYDAEDIVFGKVTVSGGKFASIDYSERTTNYLQDKIIEHLETEITFDLDLTNHKIYNLVDCTTLDCNDNDAVSKKYVDDLVIRIGDVSKVKVDADDAAPDYLYNKINVVGMNKSIEETDDGIHILKFSDGELATISGDSQSGYLDDKLVTIQPLDKVIVDGTSGKEIDLHLYYDGLASDITTHGSQPSIDISDFTIDGETKKALYVRDIFVHKSGNITETIDGDKHFTGTVTIDNLVASIPTSDCDNCVKLDQDSVPTQDDTFSMGSIDYKWHAIYASEFHGSVLQVDNADLAEKYICKDKLEVGDVVCISQEEGYEIEKCSKICDHSVIGVFSQNPAIKMNVESDGTYIALKGKVKVKVIGPVNKGDPLVTYGDGYAVSISNKQLIGDIDIKSYMVFAKALERAANGPTLIYAIIL